MLKQFLIARPKVADLIYQTILNYPLVILNAPVGYGKTILAHEVRPYFEKTDFFRQAETPPASTIYMSVNYGESNPEFLWEKHASILTSPKSPLAGLPGLRLLILSRVRPNLPLEEMRVKGQCRVFGPETLAFSLSETKCWLTRLMTIAWAEVSASIPPARPLLLLYRLTLPTTGTKSNRAP